MLFSVREMHIICSFHSGTLSATIEMLHAAKEMPGINKADLEYIAVKLAGLKDGDTVSLTFEHEC